MAIDNLFDVYVTRFQATDSEEERQVVLDDIAALFMPIVENRVLKRTYPSFGIPLYTDDIPKTEAGSDGDVHLTYHDEMRRIAKETIAQNLEVYEVGGEDCFEAFVLPKVRAAIRGYIHKMSTLSYVYLLQHELTDDERQRILGEVVEENDRLILFLVKKHYPSYQHSHQADLQQCGREALVKHAAGYDFGKINPKTGELYKFSTYITSYILDALKSYVCKYHTISPHYAVQIKRYTRAVAELKRRGIDDPTLDQIAEEMHVGLDAVRKVYNVQSRMNMVSIEEDDRDKRIPDPLFDSPERVCESKEMQAQVHSAVAHLPKEQQMVINTMYLSTDHTLSLAEVSRKLQMDVASVRRLQNQALRALSNSYDLLSYNPSKSQRNLEDFADSLVLEFTLPQEAIAVNLDIAMEMDLDGEELFLPEM